MEFRYIIIKKAIRVSICPVHSKGKKVKVLKYKKKDMDLFFNYPLKEKGGYKDKR